MVELTVKKYETKERGRWMERLVEKYRGSIAGKEEIGGAENGTLGFIIMDISEPAN